MLGDIHKRQAFVHKGINIAYPSSLIQQNFGETVSEHGFGILKIENNKLNYVFHDIENPIKYLNFRITDISDIEDGTEVLLNA